MLQTSGKQDLGEEETATFWDLAEKPGSQEHPRLPPIATASP